MRKATSKRLALLHIVIAFISINFFCGCVSPLYTASVSGNLTKVKALVKEGYDLNERDANGVTALMCSADNGHVEITELLIKNGAIIDAQDKNGYTPLMYASLFGGHTEVVEILLKAGADPTLTSNKETTALDLARSHGHIDIIKLLENPPAKKTLAQKNESNKTPKIQEFIKSPQKNKQIYDGAKLGQYRALIIANNKYTDPTGSWSSLITPSSDAKALKKILEEQYGFTNISLILNATRRKIGKALRNLIEQATEEDNILIFYAGHGYFDKDVTETGYWIPTDAEGDDDTTFVANSVIRDRVAQLSRKAKHVLLVSDSCFSGDFLSRGRGIDILSPEQKNGYFQKKNRSKSCQVLTSGGNEYVDDEYRKSGHSPFAYFLLRKLENNDEKYFSASELSAHMAKTVSNTVGQTPRHGILKTSEDEGGEFFFVKTK